MASSSQLLVLSLLFFSSFFIVVSSAHTRVCPFQSLYQFGDSISDVGNLIRIPPVGSRSYSARLPYGETFFRRPTGRCSNGLLMTDYIAMQLNLPLLNPYLARTTSVDHGVNFAVAGSTALDSSFFRERNMHVPLSNTPLSTQLNWFRNHLNRVCRSPAECSRRLQRSLVFMGEIGGNDYNYAFFQGKPIEEIRTYIPHVVQAITNAVREVIRSGVKRVVVPAYDDMKCLKGLNSFAMMHNNYLQGALAELRREYPDVVILYGDYYTAFQSVLRRARLLGFEEGSALKACCGVGGAYNYDSDRMCGSPGVPVCPNPARRIHWDGVHLTQEAYRHMAQWLMGDLLPKMECV